MQNKVRKTEDRRSLSRRLIRQVEGDNTQPPPDYTEEELQKIGARNSDLGEKAIDNLVKFGSITAFTHSDCIRFSSHFFCQMRAPSFERALI